MCSCNVFTIIVRDFIKNARKLQKLLFVHNITSRKVSELSKVVNFAKLGCYPHQINPSIAVTKK